MQKTKGSQIEFIALMAALMSVTALSIDALLPALDIIGVAIQTKTPADNQLLISMIFLGLGLGPLVFGPLADAKGRKSSVYFGFTVFIIASFLCMYTRSFEVMILGRILQGIGLSAPRTICIAIIRDLYEGDYMARIMSFVTVVFLLVPIIAPAMGKVILDTWNWQAIFLVQVIISLFVMLWFWRRQKETLKPANRIPFSMKRISKGFRETIKYKRTMGFTIIQGFIVGSFIVYISASQQIFQNQYGLVDEFPYIFAGLASAIGAAILLNANFVVRFGMEKIVTGSLIGFLAVSLLYLILFNNILHPPVYVLIGFFAMQFFCIGFMFGNLRALAMEPVGHIAGIGAAITGLISTLMAVPISTFIGRFIEETTLPLFIGFSSCAAISLCILFWIKKKAPRIVVLKP
ncbi:DHA1 family bicyclomycin/chloramphenicol resistance-like MFS transporter [Dokdonia sp. Hel_I_63]|uniref:multidrug effflux MFS transporter n=1 Tax=unclassified Dokdonia TaxID=2615033 RepID=UPI00020A66BC|nr:MULTISPECIES: multidrug effflux MFS transporter [unclassified Dokdonia]AEE20638.1 major facilitator superfamily MFS_1 [Dokdonia sp. 4H-3-7-5]TVZ23106.1 DHA1 family bicyclomycin/chloramphenicol resistance-like MFS transporter [Dokdonia sp. Hel_I_63]